MHVIYVIMGKSASGKDTLFYALSRQKDLGLKTVVTYTTRSIREGEKEGIEYHFVSNERRLELEQQGKIIEHRVYQTIYGDWHYFTVDDGQIDLENSDYLLIGTLEAYLSIREYFSKEQVRPIYLELPDGILLERALQREKSQTDPKYAEMCRRFLADREDFSEEKLKEAGINKCYNSEDRNACLAQIVDDIKRGIL